jgi:SAM-dependent methyltransferase
VSFDGEGVPFLWHGQGFIARAVAIKRVHLLYLMRIIEALRPRTVIEVGCGNALNLLVLAARFPNQHFIGIELTKGGVAAAAAATRQGIISEAVRAFSPEPSVDMRPFDRIRVIQGDAAALPIRKASADLVFTTLALEQMEAVRRKALTEIRRVAAHCTVMLEAFRDWNSSGARRDFIVANDYFSGSLANLREVGLRPVYSSADLPSKLTYQAGIVVCEAGTSA